MPATPIASRSRRGRRTDVSADEVATRAADPRSEPPRAWSELLPALRARTGTTRGALVAALATALGHPEARAQVDEHVHALETGQLAPGRVRPAVVTALARILDVPVALLERSRPLMPEALIASMQDPHYRLADTAAAPEPSPAPGQAERVPEIDDLFTGADG